MNPSSLSALRMAIKAQRLASSCLFVALLVLSVFPIPGRAEKREIYLVLMKGDSMAFLGHSPHGNETRLGLKSKVFKAQAKRFINSHDQLLESTLEMGSYNKLYSFRHIINGFAVRTTQSQAERLKNTPGVTLVERDRGVKLMTTYTPQYLGLPEGVWTQEGGDKDAGEGIVIGFVDTGIDPFHPSFAFDPMNTFGFNLSRFHGACETGPRFPASSCNGKIVSARFFSAGAQALSPLNSSVDILSPFDAVGHGSHVASTAAGNAGVPVVVNGFYYGRASGMAPRARIAVYKAIYPSVATVADVVAAIDQAAEDGVDILTLSIGPDKPPEDTVTFLSVFDIAMLFARRAGVLVLQAAGNQGPAPSSVVSYSPWAVGVAASTTDRSYPSSLLLADGHRVPGVGLSGPTLGSGLIQFKLVLAKDALKVNMTFPRTAYAEECQYPEIFDPNVVMASIVICTFSAGFVNETSTLTALIETARTLNFMGFVLVANPSYGDFIAEPIPFSMPGVMIPKVADAEVVLQYYERHIERDDRGLATKFGATAAIAEGRVASFQGRAPIVSRFSSRGPDYVNVHKDPADVLKPDILAPGHQVWAAWSPLSALDPILRGYSFALLSGTSMAAPHVAGVAALIKQRYPTWTPSMVASAISTTATKYDNCGKLIMAEGYDISSTYPSTHFDFGAGLVNPIRALDPGLVFPSGYDDYINFLCSLPDVDPDAIKTATGGFCSNLNISSSSLNLPSVTISALKGSQMVRRTILNVGTKPETYLCSVLPPNGTVVDLHPPWFNIAPQGTQDLDIRINVTRPLGDFSFGEIVLTGTLNHIVRVTLSVFPQ